MKRGFRYLLHIFLYGAAEGLGGIVSDIVWREYKLRRPLPKPPAKKRQPKTGRKRRRGASTEVAGRRLRRNRSA
jgi:hypothetical protein